MLSLICQPLSHPPPKRPHGLIAPLDPALLQILGNLRLQWPTRKRRAFFHLNIATILQLIDPNLSSPLSPEFWYPQGRIGVWMGAGGHIQL